MTLRIQNWEFDHVSYDPEADVLYLSIGEPRPGVGKETPEGHVLRYDDDGHFMGITIIGARELVESEGEVLLTVPSEAHIGAQDLEPALA